jgi:alkylation response protein AidB-like acyl-CoA dehydrogenase
VRGELLGAFAITEPGSGSDTYAMACQAERDGDDWVLSGHKAHITLAPVADVALVFASTNPSAGRWGISAFLVHRDRPGVLFGDNREKMGLRTTPYGDIVLDRYRAPAEDLVGREGAGASIFSTAMEAERGLIMAAHLGAAERAVTDALARANARRQFGLPIAAFQAVSHRLADMQMAHETARLLLYKVAAMMDRGDRVPMAAAMAKLGCSEAIASIALDAARIHGALGYEKGHDTERELRDALGGLVYSGTSDIQKNLIAALMGADTDAARKDP